MKTITIPYEEYLELTGGKVKLEEKFKEMDYEIKKDRILRIIRNFGVDAQKRKFGEECDELKEAITKYESLKDYYFENTNWLREHIVEETADVIHVLLQIIFHYDITREEIENVLWFKNNRTNEIVDDEIRKG